MMRFRSDRYFARPWELWVWRLAAAMVWGYAFGLLLDELKL
jgi:hypothetical protein